MPTHIKWIFITILLFISSNSLAIDGFSIAGGTGQPSNLRGARIAVQWDWNKVWWQDSFVHLTGYWDLSLAHWETNGDQYGKNKSITTAAIAPVFRLIPHEKYCENIIPYLEASAGLAIQSKDHLAYRDLGAHPTFQDLLGFGFIFGEEKQYDISYHYLHYSNANIYEPNRGVDVKVLVMFRYWIR